eukprot:COSAG05_NODE_15761_length_362_cov_0.593156_1_plen_25_part_10
MTVTDSMVSTMGRIYADEGAQALFR